MKLRRIDPKTIKWPEVRVTAQFDEVLYAQFKESIKTVGQIAPIICYQVGEEIVGCDGKHRCDEAIMSGEGAVDVVVIPGDEVDVLTKNIFLDHLRGKTSVSQMLRVISSLYKDYGLDPDQIREKTGLTREYIEKLIKIGFASPSVQEALDQGVIGIGHAFELSRLPHPIQQEEIIAKHQVWRFTVKELKEQIDMVLAEMEKLDKETPLTPGTEPPAPRMYCCEGCKQEAEPRYLRPVMLCPDCYGEVWRIAKAAPAEELKAAAEGGGGLNSLASELFCPQGRKTPGSRAVHKSFQPAPKLQPTKPGPLPLAPAG